MSTPVIPDISDTAADVPAPPVVTPVVEPTPDHAFRRFSFDPASSPVLMAALAWDTAGPHR